MIFESGGARHHRRIPAGLLGALSAVLWGCLGLGGCAHTPDPVPHISRLPKGFTLRSFEDPGTPVFSDRGVVGFRHYQRDEADEGSASIRITAQVGAVGYAEVLETWSKLADDDAVDTGPLAPIRAGDYPAWGWRRLTWKDDRVSGFVYTAVIPDPPRQATYTLEIRTSRPDSRKASQVDAVLAGFRRDRHPVSAARLGLAVILLAGFAVAFGKARGNLS